jgi:DNA-binding MarR family transcriptional regulator
MSSQVKRRRAFGALPPEPWLVNWYSVRPDIDRQTIAILGRIIRLNPAFERFRAGTLESVGVTPEISDLIISLLRSGPSSELNAGALPREATFPVSSTGAMTYRIDRAETLGLVVRGRDPSDRRGVIVSLTPRGKDVANRVVDDALEMVNGFLGSFSAEERTALAHVLQKLLIALEHRPDA